MKISKEIKKNIYIHKYKLKKIKLSKIKLGETRFSSLNAYQK